MIQQIIGKKIDQTQRFLTDGSRVPVTIIMASDSFVMRTKEQDKHGYVALVVGFGAKKKATKSELGQIKGVDQKTAPLYVLELKAESDDIASFPAGTMLKASNVLKPGDSIDATGISKGKGYAGVVKKHHFKGGPRTHGQSDRERAPGSIGQTTTPGRVYKGKRMSGRMGQETVTIKNLEVIDIEGDIILIKGLIPGSKNTMVVLSKTGEKKKFVPLLKKETEETKETEGAKETRETKVEEAQEAKVEEVKEPVKEETKDAS